jgi:hypothetical protein
VHTTENNTASKHFRLNEAKLKHAQELFGAATESETIERALDMAIEEHERNRIVEEAHRNFLKSGILIGDVFGRLAE